MEVVLVNGYSPLDVDLLLIFPVSHRHSNRFHDHIFMHGGSLCSVTGQFVSLPLATDINVAEVHHGGLTGGPEGGGCDAVVYRGRPLVLLLLLGPHVAHPVRGVLDARAVAHLVLVLLLGVDEHLLYLLLDGSAGLVERFPSFNVCLSGDSRVVSPAGDS